jgi:formylglycine-generating enzyme required for sulfatase activity
LVLLSLALPLLAAPDWNTLNRSVVKIVADKRPASDTGAGIVIAASSDSIRILTAAHVVADATAWKVYFYSDQAVGYAATVLPKSSDGLDLAVLEVIPQGRALPSNLPQLAMRGRDTLPLDERIWTIDSEWVHIPNTVVRLDHDSDTRLFEYTKVAVDDGFSGGAVFDEDGRLAGIHRGGGAGGRYAVAARLDAVIDALAALGHNTPNLVRVVAAVPTPPPVLRAGTTRVNPKDGLTYLWIPAGSFTIGCSPGDDECDPEEKPPHVVNITKGFWIGQTEVTQEAYEKVTGKKLSNYKGARFPVEEVRWNDAQSYCGRAGMRLPTEAEWEYAARAGSTQSLYGEISAIAWYAGNSRGGTHEVGQKAANAWGLFDTIGNVWEWTLDHYANRLPSEVNDPITSSGEYQVIRGGAWAHVFSGEDYRVSRRMGVGSDVRDYVGTGVRCVGELP